MKNMTLAANRKRLAAERRARVFEIMGGLDWETKILIQSMDQVCKWLETGAVPVKKSLKLVADKT